MMSFSDRNISLGAVEVNYDGLIGPTHNYGGLSEGNIASQKNADHVSRPKFAALQGLEKMKRLHDQGFIQGVLPPHERPYFSTLRALGFSGSDYQIWDSVWKVSPLLARNMLAASAMWTANAASISPNYDTQDQLIHMTPANLTTMLHRSIEPSQTEKSLKAAFLGTDYFNIHSALPSHLAFADEGAANHVRLCQNHQSQGVEIFVYGACYFSPDHNNKLHYPARQTLESVQALARRHRLRDKYTLFVQQSEEAINAGAFHNDVVCVGTQNCLFYHEKAFKHAIHVIEQIKRASDCLFEPCFIEVPDSEVSLQDAVQSYLFNSQLLLNPASENEYQLIAPIEVQKNEHTHRFCQKLISGNTPIKQVHYVNVRQSMCNGGGPACLRLRVVLSQTALKACNQNMLIDHTLYHALKAWIETHYRDTLSPDELSDPLLIDETRMALDELTHILGLGSDFYPFQQTG